MVYLLIFVYLIFIFFLIPDNENVDEQVHKYLQLLNDLPCPNRTLLQWMFTHFAHIIELVRISIFNFIT